MMPAVNFSAVAPEIGALCGACLALMLDLFVPDARRHVPLWLTQSLLLAAARAPLAAGILLYGMSMIYGATGSLDIAVVARELATGSGNRTILVFGLVFVVSGIAFKLGAVPYHMWVPDVYDGAPTVMTLLIGTVPKLAAYAFMLRLLGVALGGLWFDWQGMLIVLALLSMVFG